MPLSQTIAFVRREVAEVLHQPLLVLVLVIGPFAVLLLFGVGYRNEPLILRTLVVAPDDAPIDAVLERFEDRLGEAITIEGATEDLVLATQRLQDGDIDLVVVVPPDPVATVLDGRQAEIVVLHEKLDPIQQVAVDFASRLATEEVNAVVLAEVVRRGQTALTSGESLDSAVLVRPFLAYCILGGAAGGGLLVLVVRFLEVPSLGPVVHVVATVALVVGASVAIGLVLSLLAGSDSQAVQFSMLVLLASLFFSGFILDLERLRQPALAVSSVLPVTYGTRMLREVMLLGRAPAVTDYAGIATVAVVSLVLAAALLRRRLRVR